MSNSMPKKKRSTKSKRTTTANKKTFGDKANSQFMRQSFAFLMVIFALFIVLGGFGAGGPLPTKLFEFAQLAVGGVAAMMFAPVVIFYLAIQKFKHVDNITPFSKLLSSLGGLATFAAAIHVWVETGGSQLAASNGDYGGYVGHYLSSFVLNFLNNITAFIALMGVALLGFLFTLGISPRSFIGFVIRLLKRKPTKDDSVTDLADLKNGNKKFKLHEGVPLETGQAASAEASEATTKKRLSSFRNSIDRDLKGDEDHEALVVKTDPDWQLPSVNLLNQKQDKANAGNVQENAEIIRETLSNFNIDIELEGANIGPRVTQYTLKPPSGTKLAKITSLESNIALDLAAQSIRIEAPIPGKRAVGIEVPNKKAATVRISSILSSQAWRNLKTGDLHFGIGQDISGQPEIGQLDAMPHILIAGQTGSGKSVMINTLLTSLLYRNSPSDLKLILVDPKQVELTPYNDIPHLLAPVITDPEKCISSLKWAVAEMERRLRAFAGVGRRNIKEYNSQKDSEHMPYIVIVIDELADLMMMAARDVEALIVRIAQKARAAGIHLVLATQRPSVDVITGLIKANIPARVAFTTASQVDSRTIIDQVGAEKLLGTGDMLFATANQPKPRRIQAAFISDDETTKVCDFLRSQRPPQYDDEVVSQPVQFSKGVNTTLLGSDSGGEDEMWQEAIQAILEASKASTSLLQRRLRIGYSRAARIIEMMEEQSIVSPPDGSRPRDVLITSMDDVFGSQDESDPEEPLEETYSQ